MPSLGGPELIIVLVIVLLLFGGKKLPELAGSMGKSIKEFRKAADEADRDAEAREAAKAETKPEVKADDES
jgi:sec-independent protein translocase protein TatA